MKIGVNDRSSFVKAVGRIKERRFKPSGENDQPPATILHKPLVKKRLILLWLWSKGGVYLGIGESLGSDP